MVSGVTFFANNHLLTTIIPLYLTDIDINLEIIGYMVSAMGIMTILFRPVIPYLLKKNRLLLYLCLSQSLLVLLTLLIQLFPHPYVILVLRTLYGIPLTLFPIFYFTLIKRLATDQAGMGKYISLAGIAMPASLMISPFIGEMLSRISYSAAFLAASIVALLNLASSYTAGKMLFVHKAPLLSVTFHHIAKLRDELKIVILPIITFFFLGAVDVILLTYIPLYSKSRVAIFSIYFMIFALSMIFCQYVLSKIKIMKGIKSLLVVGYAFLTIAVVILFIETNNFLVLFILSGIIYGIGFSFVETATNTLVLSCDNSDQLLNMEQLAACMGRTIMPFLLAIFVADNSIKTYLQAIALLGMVSFILILFWKAPKNFTI